MARVCACGHPQCDVGDLKLLECMHATAAPAHDAAVFNLGVSVGLRRRRGPAEGRSAVRVRVARSAAWVSDCVSNRNEHKYRTAYALP
eukprot:6204418-Pleurochrysis_carterae.AAC.2